MNERTVEILDDFYRSPTVLKMAKELGGDAVEVYIKIVQQAYAWNPKGTIMCDWDECGLVELIMSIDAPTSLVRDVLYFCRKHDLIHVSSYYDDEYVYVKPYIDNFMMIKEFI